MDNSVMIVGWGVAEVEEGIGGINGNEKNTIKNNVKNSNVK